MADVIIKLKVMPSSTDINLNILQKFCEDKIKEFGAKMIHSVKQEPIAFGLKALVFTFLADEKKGDTEKLEIQIKTSKEVQSAEVIDVRRAVG